MPEQPDYDAYDVDQEPIPARGDYLVKVPRGSIRHLEDRAKANEVDQRKARAFDALRSAGVLDELGLVDRPGPDAGQPVDTPLEPGEADLTAERRALAATAPPDQVPAADPAREARRVHDQVLADGGQEKHAIGSAINSLVNAAARGDQRVILNADGTRRRDRP